MQITKTIKDIVVAPIIRIAKKLTDTLLAPLALDIVNKLLSDPAFNAQGKIRREIEDLRRDVAARMPGNPCAKGFKVYAQTDEDGIIENILQRIPDGRKTFIEIGCGRGIENNTHYLLLKGYRGCWLDGSTQNIDFIRSGLGGLELDTRLLVRNQFISVENAREIIDSFTDFLKTSELDFFSLDVDGNDLPLLMECIKYCSPRVICAEYNPKFPPPFSVSMPYVADHRWAGDDYHGASLQAFCDRLEDYRLVACNISGANAFFVRRDLSKPFPEYTSQELYQPFRENLIALRSEHAPSLKWLRAHLGAGPRSDNRS